LTRIAVVSDTHVPRFAHRLPAALAIVAAQRPAAILHCGDFTSLEAVSALEAIAPLEGVAGNNDGQEIVARFARRTIITVYGARIGLVHGDGARGTTPQRARAAFADESVAAILFGHSHIPSCQRSDEGWLINPGSPTDKRRQARFSFAVLDIRMRNGSTAAHLLRYACSTETRTTCSVKYHEREYGGSRERGETLDVAVATSGSLSTIARRLLGRCDFRRRRVRPASTTSGPHGSSPVHGSSSARPVSRQHVYPRSCVERRYSYRIMWAFLRTSSRAINQPLG